MATELTSGQYAYLLLRRLQLYVSCKDSAYRAYLYNFYSEIFNDPSVFIDEESYGTFNELMDYELDYIAKKNLRIPEDVYNDDNFSSNYIFLQNAFSAIGVKLEMVSGFLGPSSLKFTLPSGKTMELLGLSSTWNDNLRFNSRIRGTYEYTKAIMPYYMFENEEILDLREIGGNSAGYNTRWTYDEDTKTLEITGEGSLAGYQLWVELDLDNIEKMIINSGVYRICSNAFNTNDELTIIDFHGENDKIIIEPNLITTSYEKKYITIYTDNLCIQEHGISNNNRVVIDWHYLSEYNSDVVLSVLFEKKFTIEEIDGNIISISLDLIPNQQFSTGDKLRFTLNEKQSLCTVREKFITDDNGDNYRCFYIGNLSLLNSELEDNGRAYLVYYYIDKNNEIISGFKTNNNTDVLEYDIKVERL